MLNDRIKSEIENLEYKVQTDYKLREKYEKHFDDNIIVTYKYKNNYSDEWAVADFKGLHYSFKENLETVREIENNIRRGERGKEIVLALMYSEYIEGGMFIALSQTFIQYESLKSRNEKIESLNKRIKKTKFKFIKNKLTKSLEKEKELLAGQEKMVVANYNFYLDMESLYSRVEGFSERIWSNLRSSWGL